MNNYEKNFLNYRFTDYSFIESKESNGKYFEIMNIVILLHHNLLRVFINLICTKINKIWIYDKVADYFNILLMQAAIVHYNCIFKF